MSEFYLEHLKNTSESLQRLLEAQRQKLKEEEDKENEESILKDLALPESAKVPGV